jgi:hypothetical protein
VAPDQVAGLRLLLGIEEPAMPRLGPARAGLQPGRAPLGVALADIEHPGRAQPDLSRDRIVGHAGLAQADHLPPAFLWAAAGSLRMSTCFMPPTWVAAPTAPISPGPGQ